MVVNVVKEYVAICLCQCVHYVDQGHVCVNLDTKSKLY